MLNFLLGTMAGGTVVAVALVVGLRQPAVLERLDLTPKPAPTLPLAKRSEPACAPAPKPDAERGRSDLLFEPRRFWFVAP